MGEGYSLETTANIGIWRAKGDSKKMVRKGSREQVNEWTVPRHGVDRVSVREIAKTSGHLLTLGVVRSKASSLEILQKKK